MRKLTLIFALFFLVACDQTVTQETSNEFEAAYEKYSSQLSQASDKFVEEVNHLKKDLSNNAALVEAGKKSQEAMGEISEISQKATEELNKLARDIENSEQAQEAQKWLDKISQDFTEEMQKIQEGITN